MSGPGAGVPRDERPAPTVFHAGVIVPAELCAELASALEEYVGMLPPARRAGRLSRPVAGVLRASREAAAVWQLQQHRERAAWAAPTVPAVAVLGCAQLNGESVAEELTTAQAADIAGYSPEWWRRLAVRGTVRARQVERRTWLLSKADVVGYATHARQEKHHDGGDDDHGTGPSRTAC